MHRIYTVFVGLLFLLFSSNCVVANTEIIEVIVKPAAEMNFLQGLEKKAIKTFQIELIIKKLVIQDLHAVEVFPFPKEKERLEIVFPQVVIDDVIVYRHEESRSATFAIGDKQYCMVRPLPILGQQSPG